VGAPATFAALGIRFPKARAWFGEFQIHVTIRRTKAALRRTCVTLLASGFIGKEQHCPSLQQQKANHRAVLEYQHGLRLFVTVRVWPRIAWARPVA